MIKEAILKVTEGKNLTRKEASLTAQTIMNGDASPSQISALLTALHIKGETVEELTGFAEQMREFSCKIDPKMPNLVDTCGTGGDSSHTFNISTVSALVVSGAGVPIAKHGNRSVSSKCGSADLLESFGVKVDLSPEKVCECIQKIGFGFMFAQVFHPAMKFAAPVRRELGFRTIFNLLGPLTNPAGAKRQIIGVYSEKLVDMVADVFLNLGMDMGLIVHGMDGLDEISLSEKTKVAEIKNGKVKKYFIKPEDFKMKKSDKSQFKANNVEESKVIALSILEQGNPSPNKDIVVLNAAAALYVSGVTRDIKEGIDIASQSICTGSALKKLKQLIDFSRGA